jgi:hypothetical protein
LAAKARDLRRKADQVQIVGLVPGSPTCGKSFDQTAGLAAEFSTVQQIADLCAPSSENPDPGACTHAFRTAQQACLKEAASTVEAASTQANQRTGERRVNVSTCNGIYDDIGVRVDRIGNARERMLEGEAQSAE